MKRRSMLVILSFVLFTGIVYASPPSVDFNFTPISPVLLQNIIFAPTITASPPLNQLYWMFDTDGNVNTFASRGVIYDSNFDSGISDWNTTSFGAGMWDNNGGTLQTPSDDSNASHRISYSTFSSGDVNFFVRLRQANGAASNLKVGWNSPTNNVPGNGAIPNYAIQYENGAGSGVITFRYNGSVLATFASGLSPDTYYDVNVNRHNDGNFDFYFNGTYVSSLVNTTSDMNGSFLNVGFGDGGNSFGQIDRMTLTSSSVINSTQTQNHSFSTGGTKNVCLTGGNVDGNTTACHSFSIGGNLVIKVYDENTGLSIPFPIAVFDTNIFTGDANGLIILSTPSLTEDARIPIYATGYPARYFTYRVDINSSFSITAYLLDQNKGRDIQFVVRDVNAVKYPNKFFRIIKDQNVVTQVYLNNQSLSDPIWLSNLTTDYNFFVDQNSTSGTNIFSYGNSNLQINIPANEATNEIVSPYGIQISDLTSIDINNQTTSRIFRIYPNTYHPYFITIDANNLDYFPRYYHLRTTGGQISTILQPWLLRASDNGIPATMIVKDSLTSLSLQYYMFELYADANGMANQLIESPQTDTAGAFIFTTITGKNYFLKIYDPFGDLVKQGQFISSTSNQYFLDLFTGVLNDIQPHTGIVDVNLLIPSGNFYFLNDSNNFGTSFIINSTGPSILSTNIAITTGSTTLLNQTFSPSFPATNFPSGSRFDTNFSTSLNNVNVQVTITVVTNGGLVIKTFSFPLKQDTNPTISFPGFGTFCSSVGQLGCSLIWLLIGLMISIGLRFNPVFGVDNNGMFWVMALWTGIAAFIGLVPYTIGFIAILAGASYWAIRNRPLG